MTKKNFIPKTKADDQVIYDENEPETFSEFEFLKARIDVLEKAVKILVDILRDNNVTRTETIHPEYPDLTEVYEKLEEEE